MTKKLTAADLDRLVNGRDDLQLALSRCNETKTALQMNLRGAHKEREGLATQNHTLRVALSEVTRYAEVQVCTHEETHRGGAIWEICDSCGASWADDRGGKPAFREDMAITSARNALALPDTSAEILRARDARVLRDAAERLESHDFVMNSSGKWYAEASELRKLADDLGQKK